MIPILHNLFQKVETEEIIPNPFNKASLILKSENGIRRKIKDQYLSLRHILDKILTNQIQ